MGASKGSPFESCRVSVGGKTLYAEVDIKKRKKKSRVEQTATLADAGRVPNRGQYMATHRE